MRREPADAYGGGNLDLDGVLALADLGRTSRPDLSDHLVSAFSNLALLVRREAELLDQVVGVLCAWVVQRRLAQGGVGMRRRRLLRSQGETRGPDLGAHVSGCRMTPSTSIEAAALGDTQGQAWALRRSI